MRQNFSLPEQSIIYYISKNVSSPTVYSKLIKCCKYFYQQKKVLLFHCLFYYDYENKKEWYICPKIGGESCTERNGKICNEIFSKKIALKKIKQKIWVTNSLEILPQYFKNLQSFALNLDISYNKIYLKQLLQHSSFSTKCSLYETTVLNENYSEASIAEIIAHLPSVEDFYFVPKTPYIANTKAVKELIQALKVSKIKKFDIRNISENFDIETFYHQFLKKNKTMNVSIKFHWNVSREYIRKLETIIYFEILQSNNFWPPLIWGYFNEINHDLLVAYESYCKMKKRKEAGQKRSVPGSKFERFLDCLWPLAKYQKHAPSDFVDHRLYKKICKGTVQNISVIKNVIILLLLIFLLYFFKV